MATYWNKTIFSFWSWDVPMVTRVFVLTTLGMLLSYISSKDKKDKTRKKPLQILTWIAIAINIVFIIKLWVSPPPPSHVIEQYYRTRGDWRTKSAQTATNNAAKWAQKANTARLASLRY